MVILYLKDSAPQLYPDPFYLSQSNSRVLNTSDGLVLIHHSDAALIVRNAYNNITSFSLSGLVGKPGVARFVVCAEKQMRFGSVIDAIFIGEKR